MESLDGNKNYESVKKKVESEPIFDDYGDKHKSLERSKKMKINGGSSKNIKSQTTVSSYEAKEKFDINKIEHVRLDNV